jgi:hypothetical protein
MMTHDEQAIIQKAKLDLIREAKAVSPSAELTPQRIDAHTLFATQHYSTACLTGAVYLDLICHFEKLQARIAELEAENARLTEAHHDAR